MATKTINLKMIIDRSDKPEAKELRQALWTTLATCKKQGRNVFDFIYESVVAHWSNKNYPSLIGELP